MAAEGGKIDINPDDDYVLKEGDEVLVIAEDDYVVDDNLAAEVIEEIGDNLWEPPEVQNPLVWYYLLE